MVADLAEPFREGKRVEQIRGTGTLPNFFRKPYGDGWALVGDAGWILFWRRGSRTRFALRNGSRMRFTPDFRPPGH
jgi:hypothetical protein